MNIEFAWESTPFNDEFTETYDRSHVKLYDDITQPEPEPVLTLEAAPDPNNAEAVALWNQLSSEDKLAVTQEILPWILEQVALRTKTFISEPILQRGGYHGDPNYSMLCRIADGGDYVKVAKLLASYLRQDTVMAISPKAGEGMRPSKVIRIQLPDGFTEAQVDDLYQNHIDKIRDANGNRLIEGQSTADGVMMLSVEAEHIDEIKAGLVRVLEPYNGKLPFGIDDAFTGFLKPYSKEEKTNAGMGDDARREGGVRQETSAGYDADLQSETDQRLLEMVKAKAAERAAGANRNRTPNGFRQDRVTVITQDQLRAAQAQLAVETKAWQERIDNLKSKPRQHVLMLRQTPVVMHLVGADFLELRAAPHVFDGMFPGSKKSKPNQHEHPEMTADVLKQLPQALTDPIAITYDDHNKSYVFVLEVKNKLGKTVAVPVRFNATGSHNAELNLIKTAYGKKGETWLGRQGSKNTLRYVNREKLGRVDPSQALETVKRLEEKPGDNSLRAPNASLAATDKYVNADGSTVLDENDLVKAKVLLKLKTGASLYQLGYHGSPYVFDSFTLSHIGSGQGAQSHGWGLYFALERATAEDYRNELTRKSVRYSVSLSDGRTLELSDNIEERRNEDALAFVIRTAIRTYRDQFRSWDVPADWMKSYAQKGIDYAQQRIAVAQRRGVDAALKAIDESQPFLDVFRQLEKNPVSITVTIKQDRGRLYTVDIPEDDVMLREDATFADQPKKVRTALRKIFASGHFDGFIGAFMDQWEADDMLGMKAPAEAIDKIRKKYGNNSVDTIERANHLVIRLVREHYKGLSESEKQDYPLDDAIRNMTESVGNFLRYWTPREIDPEGPRLEDLTGEEIYERLVERKVDAKVEQL